MIRFYLNRELSEKLDINLAKWKRWSREFLPPDPLGGLQSGYARQYSPSEAFRVFLGGHLVGDLKYSIPEAEKILSDLTSWLEKNDFLAGRPVEKRFEIRIMKKICTQPRKPCFTYRIDWILKDMPADEQKGTVRKMDVAISTYDPLKKIDGEIDQMSIRLLRITEIQNLFCRKVNNNS